MKNELHKAEKGKPDNQIKYSCLTKWEKVNVYCKFYFRCMHRRPELFYLHGDVGYGGRGQVKVLLDQNVEFGGQVTSCTNAMNLAGEQGRDLSRRDTEENAGEKWLMPESIACHVWLGGTDSPLFLLGQSPACLHPVGICESGPARTAGWPSSWNREGRKQKIL